MEKATIHQKGAWGMTDGLHRRHQSLRDRFADQMYDPAKREEYESQCWDRMFSLAQKRRFEKLSDNCRRRFLLEVYRRVYLEQLRKYRREAKAITLWSLDKQAAKKNNNPGELAANRELVGAIVAFVNTMPEPDRKIFYYSIFEGRKSTWIGRKMKMPSDTVRVRLHRIRRRIVERFPDCF